MIRGRIRIFMVGPFLVACGAIHRLFCHGNEDDPGESIVRTLSHGVSIFL